ncbi:MAG: VTT domain-containing protein [Propionibacteriaceae bacterium]
MSELYSHLLLGLSILVGSAVPFVPTGELVSGASALANHTVIGLLLIFFIGWSASVAGDTLLLLEVRLVRGGLQRWLDRRSFGARVDTAQQKVAQNAFTAVISGRLLPGGRAPVILALGLSQFSRRRFILFDTVACALWAAIYAVIGSIGGRVASQPIWGMVIAIAAALMASLVVQQVRRVVRRHHQSAAQPDQTPASDVESLTPSPSARH